MKSFSIVVAAALTFGASGSASADPGLGSRLGKDHDADHRAYSDADAARQAAAFVSCMVAKHESSARTMLDSTDEASSERAAKAMLREDRCNQIGFENGMSDTTSFTYPADVLRGMVAERLIGNSFDRAAMLPAMPLERIYARQWFAMTGRDAVVDAMAVCLTENAPTDVVGLLRTGAYSAQEMAAVQVLGPTMGKCLQVGYKLHANRQTLRAAIAEALYHRLNAPVAAAAGK